MAEETIDVVTAPVALPDPAPLPTPEEIAAARALLARVPAEPTPPMTLATDSTGALVPAPAPIVPEPPKNLCMALRAWNKAKCAGITTFWSTIGAAACVGRVIKGVRTLAFFSVTGASALFASIEGIDLSGVASKLTGLDVQYSDLILGMSVAGFGLRLITSSSVFKQWRSAARGDGEAPGTGGGDVDEPETDTPAE